MAKNTQTDTNESNVVITTFDATRYAQGNPATNAIQAHADHEALAEVINAKAESTSTIKSKLETAFINRHKRAAKFAIRKMTEGLVAKFVKYPGLATAILPEIKALASITREWSDMQLAVEARQVREESEVPEELIETAESIRNIAKTMYDLCITMHDAAPDELKPMYDVSSLPTRNVKGGGSTVQFSRVSVNNNNVGRGAKRSKYRFHIDGIPTEATENMYPQECIMTYVGSWVSFLDYLKSQEIEFTGETFNVEWNGKRIIAFIPENEGAVEGASDNNTPDTTE